MRLPSGLYSIGANQVGTRAARIRTGVSNLGIRLMADTDPSGNFKSRFSHSPDGESVIRGLRWNEIDHNGVVRQWHGMTSPQKVAHVAAHAPGLVVKKLVLTPILQATKMVVRHAINVGALALKALD